MGSWAATIFVEGDSDLRFIEQYLVHCSAFAQLDNACVVIDRGNSLAGNENPQPGMIRIRKTGNKSGGNETALLSGGGRRFAQEIQKSEKTLVLLDANGDPDGRRERFHSRVKDLADKIKIDTESIHLFLVPDDNGKGALEDLLLRIAQDSDAVGKCFESHRQCLRDFAKICESRLPGAKQKFYVYCDTVLGTIPQKCDFSDSHWDLNSYLLNPLRDFLATHLLQSP